MSIDINSIKKITNEYGTPFYLFDIDKLHTWVDKVNDVFSRKTGCDSDSVTNDCENDITLCYAIKANTFLTPYMLEKIDFLEVCSPGEFQICKKYNVDSKHIIFSGVVKYKEDVEALFADSSFDGTITIESPKHFELIKKVTSELNISSVKVLPRLSSGNKFGMSKDEVKNIIKRCNEINSEGACYFEVTGIQFFSGTQKKRMSIYEKELKELDEFLDEIRSELLVDINFIEYGPGMLYEYYDDVDQLDVAKTVCENIKPYLKKYRFTLEIGRYFAACAGSYVTKVVDVKHTDDKNYALVDGGIHHVNYYGRMLGMNEPDVVLLRGTGVNCLDCLDEGCDLHKMETGTGVELKKWEVGGALCTANDVLLRNYECDELNEGDLFIFNDTGAYSPMEAPILFLSRKVPAIFSVKQGEIKMLRDFIEAWEINS